MLGDHETPGRFTALDRARRRDLRLRAEAARRAGLVRLAASAGDSLDRHILDHDERRSVYVDNDEFGPVPIEFNQRCAAYFGDDDRA